MTSVGGDFDIQLGELIQAWEAETSVDDIIDTLDHFIILLEEKRFEALKQEEREDS